MPLVSRDTVQTKKTCNPGQVEPPRTGDEEEAAIDITNVRGGAHGMNAPTAGSPLPSADLFPFVSRVGFLPGSAAPPVGLCEQTPRGDGARGR